MDLSKANFVANVIVSPTKKLKDISTDQVHRISNFGEAQTQYGKRIIVELYDEFVVFLPARMVKLYEVDEEFYNEMKKAALDNHLGLQYFGGKYSKIEFKHL